MVNALYSSTKLPLSLMPPLIEGVASCPLHVVGENVISSVSWTALILQILTIDEEDKYKCFGSGEFKLFARNVCRCLDTFLMFSRVCCLNLYS